MTFSWLTLLPQQFQEFHPIGGVRAILSPISMRKFLLSTPLAFVALSVTLYVPAFFTAPLMMPVAGSSDNPFGRPSAENAIGRSPVQGIL